MADNDYRQPVDEAPTAGESADPAERLSAAMHPRYTIERQIGEGATATVYVAFDHERDRRVAIKVLRSEFAELTGERFLREIRVSASLQHPNILPLFDSGSIDGALYYVMPYVEGASLKDRIAAEGPLPISDVIGIGIEVADALDHAHRHGVVHRDIKPGNILLSDGHAIVADFGIASAVTVAGGDRLTHSGLVVGTPAYMSPEQASGGEVDGRSDLYALGCLLFEMLVGELPFSGRTARAVLAKQLVEPAPSMPNLRAQIPLHVDATVRCLMAKTAADRPDSAAQVRRYLLGEEPPPKSVLAGDPATAPQWKPLSATRRISVAILAIFAVAAAWWFLRPTGPSPVPIERGRVMVFPLVEEGRGSQANDGFLAANLIGSAIETAGDLDWRDGWSALTDRDRAGFSLLAPASHRAAARANGGAWSISGSLRAGPDSTRVFLELQDSSGDSLVARVSRTVAAGPSGVAEASASAVRSLLPYLTDDTVRATALLGRSPEALSNHAGGLLAYRQSRFDRSLSAFTAAVESDSTFATAAVGGALATIWMQAPDLADSLLSLAGRHDEYLPERYRHLGAAVGYYWHGAADSALAALDRVSSWAHAPAMKGEVYYHLMPSSGPADSLAEYWFREAQRRDPGLSPPLFHLAEIVVRRGELENGDSLANLFASFDPDSTYARRLDIMLSCVGERDEVVDWTAMLATALQLAAAGRQPRCAERALRGVLAAADMSADAGFFHRWGAFFALQALYVAQGRDAEAAAMIDSSTNAGTSGDLLLYVLDAMAGADMHQQALAVQAIADERYESLEGLPPLILWLFGTWYAHVADTTQVARYFEATAARAADTGDEQVTLYADALEGHLWLARGDTSRAISLWRGLHPVVNVDDLEWSYGESFPVENLELARLLLARGDASEAYDVARVFDHPGPIIYLAFLPASLAVRYEAGRLMERPDLAREARERVLRLGREDLLAPLDGGVTEPPETGGSS